MVVWYFISVIVITIKHQYQSVQVERKSHTLLTHDLSGFTFLRVWSWANSRFCFSQSSSSHTPQSPIRPPSRSNLSPFHDTNKYHQQEGTPKVLFPFNRHYFTILAHGKRSDRIYAIRLAHTSTHTYTHTSAQRVLSIFTRKINTHFTRNQLWRFIHRRACCPIFFTTRSSSQRIRDVAHPNLRVRCPTNFGAFRYVSRSSTSPVSSSCKSPRCKQ